VKAALVLSLLAALGCSRRDAWPDAAPSASVAFPAAPTFRPSGSAASVAPKAGAPSTPGIPRTPSPSEILAKLGVPESQFYAPKVVGSEVRPLLVFLHGLGASGKAGFDALGLRALGEKERIFVVAPDGRVDSKNRRFWNAHPACCDFDQKGGDDVERLKEIINGIETSFSVDKARVYVVGFSNGGFMAQKLACTYGHALTAVVSIAAAHPPDEACALSKLPLAVLEVHGDADDVVSYQGGTLFQKPDAPRHSSAEETLAYWGKELECRGKPKAGPSLDLDPRLPGAETLTQRYDRCTLGSAELWTVQGGSHLIGTRPQFVEQVWRFLGSHRKY
jgi:polyhydroxybutyrate depolymerase